MTKTFVWNCLFCENEDRRGFSHRPVKYSKLRRSFTIHYKTYHPGKEKQVEIIRYYLDSKVFIRDRKEFRKKLKENNEIAKLENKNIKNRRLITK